jgi:putative DNA primase/helicase
VIAPEPMPAPHDDEQTYFVERAEPIPLAESFVDAHHRDAEGRHLLRRWRQDFYIYTGTHFEHMSAETLDACVYQHLEKTWKIKRHRETGEIESDKHKNSIPAPVVPRKNLVTEVRLALPSRGLLVDDTIDAPMWLDGREVPDPLECVACRNGLLDLSTGKFLQHSPDLFAVNAIDFDYDADAPEPTEWLRFLNQLWGVDWASILTLQRWFGYCLTPDTSQQKGLLLVGPKRSGKGTIARVQRALIGTSNVCAPTLAGLATNFGLSSLLDKPLGIISDARLSRRTDQAVDLRAALPTITTKQPRSGGERARVYLGVRLKPWLGKASRLRASKGPLARSGTRAYAMHAPAREESF